MAVMPAHRPSEGPRCPQPRFRPAPLSSAAPLSHPPWSAPGRDHLDGDTRTPRAARRRSPR